MQCQTNQSDGSLLLFLNDTKKLIESLFFNKYRYLKIKANKNINTKMQNIPYTYVANVSPET